MTTETLVGSGLFIFLLGAVFWGGATFNRIGKIEADVQEMKNQISTFLSAVAEYAGIKERVDGHEKRLDRLEKL
jgi:hypothetical protein